MKKIKNLILVLASFMAGVVFIASCGGSIKSFAEDTVTAALTALEVSFDKTDTSLDSETIQDAITELASVTPFVKDSTGQKIGMYLGNYNVSDDQQLMMLFDLKAKTTVLVDPISGTLIGMNQNLFYTTSDCTGTSYYLYGSGYLYDEGSDAYFSGETAPIYMNGKLYTYNSTGSKIAVSDVNSYQSSEDGTCTTWSAVETHPGSIPSSTIIKATDINNYTPALIEAKEIAITPYTGPLSIY